MFVVLSVVIIRSKEDSDLLANYNAMREFVKERIIQRQQYVALTEILQEAIEKNCSQENINSLKSKHCG